MLEVLAQSSAEQAAWWGGRRGRGWRPAWWEKAGREALAARAELAGESCWEFLSSRGFQLEFSRQPSRIGPLRLRARLNLPRRHLLVFEEALGEVAEALARLGHSEVAPRDLVLAHETFHVLRPECPGQWAELAAHRFAGDLLGLPFFAGLVDCV